MSGSAREGAAAGLEDVGAAADAGFAEGASRPLRTRAVSPAAITVLAMLVVLALAGMVAAYLYYQNTLRAAQERSLTTMAESASQNLSSYFDLRMGELDLQFSDGSVSRAVAAASGDAAAAVEGLLDEFGRPDACVTSVGLVAAGRVGDGRAVPADAQVRFAVGTSWESFADAAAGFDDAFVGYWYLDGDDCTMALYRPVRVKGETAAYVVELVDLGAVYDAVLGSIQVGELGYCTVKDPDRVIVMHRLASQIGVDTQVDRVEGHPEGDWDDLFASQYSGEPGCQIVRSYWWDNPDAGLARKFIAYAPAPIDGNYFVVNVVMAYDDLMRPLWTMWALCIALGATVLLVVSLGGWNLAKSVQNARHLQRELAYEKALHAQTRRVKLQEQQIQQIDRLQTVGIVSSSLAHELKNLMTPLLVYGQMLKDGGLSADESREIADEVEVLARRCSDLLKRMLAYARDRPADAPARVFDATAAVRDALVMIGPLCPRDVALEADVCEDPCPLVGDPGSMGQILLNLVTNALYAMHDGGGVLGIAWGPDAGHPGSFALRVSDTGCGMDRTTLQKLFNSFFTTKGAEGTGLGMSVVQALVRAMCGGIEVESAPGQGSVFTVRFPAGEGPQGRGAGPAGSS